MPYMEIHGWYGFGVGQNFQPKVIPYQSSCPDTSARKTHGRPWGTGK